MNPFILETALIAHISGSIASLSDVGSFGKYQQRVAESDMPPLPSVYVMPDEATVTESGDTFDVERQLWVVTILVDHSPDDSDVDTTAIKAGVIMEQLTAALVGWRPEYQGARLQGYKPMRYAGRETPIYAPGFGEFPVLFESGLVLTGS